MVVRGCVSWKYTGRVVNIADMKWTLLFTILVSVIFYNPTDSGAVQLTNENFDTLLATNEIVFVNFYADWCRFSNLLAPIWDEAAEKIAGEIPQQGKVLVGKVDCDKETSIATRFHITKYPTLKMMRNGQLSKREYRGQRSAESFLNFIKEQLVDPIKEFTSLQELSKLDEKKRIVIGYFEQKDTTDYDNFRKVAMNLKDDCVFYAGFGETAKHIRPPGESIITFRPAKATSNEKDETFTGNIQSFDELNIWTTDKCVPLVREITFENAEELTEEGLPFLILFHLPTDNEVVKKYSDVVNGELLDDKQNVNFLTADGLKFAHPLHHLGKSKNDLPLIAIDSFRHMYLFPDIKDMEKPGKLKQFLQDLYSGKLHREFHYGPGTTSSTEVPKAVEYQPTAGGEKVDVQKKATTPPESTFKMLGPSKNRYTLLRDEL